MSEMPIRKDENDARQGKTGLNVRYVLITGLVLVVVAFVAISIFAR